MKILFLGYPHSPLIDFLEKEHEEVIVIEERVSPLFIKENKIDFIVIYGYRYVIKKEVLAMLPNKVINLHISYLPFNKGADPNFWSFMEDTPKGVTIHLVDEGVDTGDIICQQLVELSCSDNLKKTYELLQNSIQKLFMNNWNSIKEQKIRPEKQVVKGTSHKLSEKEQYISEIKDKWLEIPISELVDYVRKIQISRRGKGKHNNKIQAMKE